MKKIDPFAVETVALRVPLTVGERTIDKLNFQCPTGKDILFAGQYVERSIPFAYAMLCSLTGEPDLLLRKLVPEDWADCMVIVNRAYQRYCGELDLFARGDTTENPQTADIPSGNS